MGNSNNSRGCHAYQSKSGFLAVKCIKRRKIRLHTYIPLTKIRLINDCIRSGVVVIGKYAKKKVPKKLKSQYGWYGTSGGLVCR